MPSVESPQLTHPPPWQVHWKRPRLDSVDLGFHDEDGEKCEYEDIENAIRYDWVPISCASVVLTRDEARRAIFELDKQDRLLVMKRKQQQREDFAHDDGKAMQQQNSGARTPPKFSNNTQDGSEQNTPRNSNIKNPSLISPAALQSPSSWFKKSYKRKLPLQTQDTTKSPMAKSPTKLDPNAKKSSGRDFLSPPSSNLFTTFSNLSSRQVEHTATNRDEPHSPPILTDASTASSLLWEDNTLTSVSEEDAVAFRMYESSKLRQKSDAGVSEPLTLKHSNEEHVQAEKYDENGNLESGRYYRDKHGNLRSRDYDGFDNVVLSVTIYATPSCYTSANNVKEETIRKDCPTSGDVFVMELISTKNPPLDKLTISLGTSKQRKVSSSSSSQTYPPPPPGDSDSSAMSSASHSQHQTRLNDDEEHLSLNHTRIISRRVLRWPSSFTTNDEKMGRHPTIYNGMLYLDSLGCPSLVSLGRTVIEAQHDDVNVLSPKQEDRSADAIDAIRCLDFLFGDSGMMTSPTEIKSSSGKDKGVVDDTLASNGGHQNKRLRMKQPLCLCLITNDGRVVFFHAMRVFLNRAVTKTHPNVSNSFAALLFGEELLNKVRDDVMPLSHPNAVLELSQVKSSVDCSCNSADNSPAIWNNIMAKHNSDMKIPGIKDDEFQPNDWSRLINFDASIDPTSLQYRTLLHSNVITGSCITSNTGNAFLVVCGKGLYRAASISHRSTHYTLGGFVTFISLRHHTETRTAYVPFAIDRIQPVIWNGCHYVMLLGEKGAIGISSCDRWKEAHATRPFAMAIRVDSKQDDQSPVRFQPIVVDLPSTQESLGTLSSTFFRDCDTKSLNEISCKTVSVSSIPSCPPGIILTIQSTFQEAASLVVVLNCSLSKFQGGVFSTSVCRGHELSLRWCTTETTPGNIWCSGGQGWSLLGNETNCSLYYISWEGTTDQGPYLLELSQADSDKAQPTILPKHQRHVISAIMPIISNVVTKADDTFHNAILSTHRSSSCLLPFTSEYRMTSFLPIEGEVNCPEGTKNCSPGMRNSIIFAAINEGGIDNALVNALGSISTKPDRSKALAMSHEQKSKRILQHCSSWTQLDDTRANRGIIHGQVPSTVIRVGAEILTLTFRTNVVTNPLTTPYNQILSWLCQRMDYYTAAGVALSLLNDVEAVYELRGIPKELTTDSIANQGFLDGITPLSTGDITEESKTLTSLADMTVGCLIKGGTSMASTLEGFLSRNKLYDSARASLMLVGTIALKVSSEPIETVDYHENIVDSISKAKGPSDNVLWPIKSLFSMAVARNCLSSALLLLNSTIPNELRWRQPQARGIISAPRPSLGLFLAAIQIILESTDAATRALLDLYDDESGLTYWNSIGNDTRLAMCLFSVNGKYVLIQQPEARAWVLEQLKEGIGSLANRTHNSFQLPDEWLCEIITGVICNAECELSLGLDSTKKTASGGYEKDSFSCYREKMVSIQDLLVPLDDSGGLDFDVVIPSLLILSSRGKKWREGSSISTQILLNTVCDLAGRKTSYAPRFLFDGHTVMQQCALAENVQAAAFLVGGRCGLILECADLLVNDKLSGLFAYEVSMKEAEIALLGGSLFELQEMMKKWDIGHSEDTTLVWAPSEIQCHLLWLIEHHIINVNTYGDFSAPSQGKISPVTAGRICFRAWLCLTGFGSSSISSTKWLEAWLRQKLDLKDGVTSKRLACAALIRVLLWEDEECSALDLNDCDDDNEPVLGSMIGFDVRFMAELSHACVGLIQSIPPHLQTELATGLSSNSSAIFSFEVDGHYGQPLNGTTEEST